ncbi:hypothetical protein AB9K35_19430 [Leisingera sp. XS_AS12]
MIFDEEEIRDVETEAAFAGVQGEGGAGSARTIMGINPSQRFAAIVAAFVSKPLKTST